MVMIKRKSQIKSIMNLIVSIRVGNANGNGSSRRRPLGGIQKKMTTTGVEGTKERVERGIGIAVDEIMRSRRKGRGVDSVVVDSLIVGMHIVMMMMMGLHRLQ